MAIQGAERTVGIYMESIVLRMDTIASVKFVGKNITRSGVVPVATKQDVPKVTRAANRSEIYNKQDKGECDEADLQTSQTDVLMQRDLDFPPFDNGH